MSWSFSQNQPELDPPTTVFMISYPGLVPVRTGPEQNTLKSLPLLTQ